MEDLQRISRREEVEKILMNAGAAVVALTRADFWSRQQFDQLKNPRFFILKARTSEYSSGQLAVVHDRGIVFCHSRDRVRKVGQKTVFAVPYLWNLETYDRADYNQLIYEDGTFYFIRPISPKTGLVERSA